ncbi:MAG: glycosyl transferase family 1 [Fimbriimonadales bacterium]|nr:MAG: glycosyl transferase family 1 [Fimbriimonadales bacterium]
MRNMGGAERVNRAVLEYLGQQPEFAPRAIFLKNAGELGHLLANQGVPIVELGIQRRTEFLRGLRRLIQHLREQPVDLLFTAEDKICMASATILRRLRIVSRYVICFHGTRTWRGFIGAIHASAVRAADMLVALSPRHKLFWQQHYGLPEQKLVIISNGIPLHKFRPFSNSEKAALRRHHGLAPDQFTVGLIAFFKDSKNLPGFVQVAKQVIDTGIKAQFVLVGDGPERKALDTAITAMRLEAQFHLPGLTDSPETWYGMFDCALMTSLTEAFPITLIEAMACGLPVVATDIAGIPDIVVHGETGFLASPSEIDKLAQYVVQLARNPELRQRMGEAGRRRALAEFDVNVMVERYARMFREVVERK